MSEKPRLPARYDPEDLCSALDDYGCCVVEGAVSEEVLDAVTSEMAPFVEDTPRGTSDFTGAGTRRIGLVVGRSPTFRSHLARHPVILAAGDHVLGNAPTWNLSFAHYFELFSGEADQLLHRDTWKYGAPAFPYEVDLNALWAVTEFQPPHHLPSIGAEKHLFMLFQV